MPCLAILRLAKIPENHYGQSIGWTHPSLPGTAGDTQTDRHTLRPEPHPSSTPSYKDSLKDLVLKALKGFLQKRSSLGIPGNPWESCASSFLPQDVLQGPAPPTASLPPPRRPLCPWPRPCTPVARR